MSNGKKIYSPSLWRKDIFNRNKIRKDQRLFSLAFRFVTKRTKHDNRGMR